MVLMATAKLEELSRQKYLYKRPQHNFFSVLGFELRAFT
jgi:hypothetical protein